VIESDDGQRKVRASASEVMVASVRYFCLLPLLSQAPNFSFDLHIPSSCLTIQLGLLFIRRHVRIHRVRTPSRGPSCSKLANTEDRSRISLISKSDIK
jgi:hypothetical protein